MDVRNKNLFDRNAMIYFPLVERFSKLDIRTTCVYPHTFSEEIPSLLTTQATAIADEILAARKRGAAVMCVFGAHTIKNGMGWLLGDMAKRGWITHLATNGAGVIHDWEFAYLGKSSEDVRANVQKGCFGTWEETGLYINLALAVGAYRGLGYGESVGVMIVENGLDIPERKELAAVASGETGASPAQRAAALDLWEVLESIHIPSGFFSIEHPFSSYSAQAAAYLANVPFTSHPMFGHDIIYTHRANRGAAVGRTAERDFLSFVSSVSNLEGGVYLSVGSAVMSPMIFEKSLSMARNVAVRQKKQLLNFAIHVVDLQKETWDWSKGEPDMDNPAYYLRFMKTFNRMGAKSDYIAADNRQFFVALYRELEKRSTYEH